MTTLTAGDENRTDAGLEERNRLGVERGDVRRDEDMGAVGADDQAHA
jgi:hypothetical protein